MDSRYQAVVAAVEDAINEADPVALLEGGAPADEYGPEVGTIVPRVVNAQSVEEVTTVLYEEFLRWFGDDTAAPRQAYEAPARDRCRSVGGSRFLDGLSAQSRKTWPQRGAPGDLRRACRIEAGDQHRAERRDVASVHAVVNSGEMIDQFPPLDGTLPHGGESNAREPPTVCRGGRTSIGRSRPTPGANPAKPGSDSLSSALTTAPMALELDRLLAF